MSSMCMCMCMCMSYILKAKKFAEPPFQSKKLRKKCGLFLGHFGSFLAIFGPFRGIFGQICGKFKFFCGPIGVMGLAFRMYVSRPPWPNPRVILPPPHICIPPSQPVTHSNTKLMNAPPAPHITNPDYATPLIIQPPLISIIDRCDQRQITVMSQIICHLGIIQFCSIPILNSTNSYISTYMPKMTKK